MNIPPYQLFLYVLQAIAGGMGIINVGLATLHQINPVITLVVAGISFSLSYLAHALATASGPTVTGIAGLAAPLLPGPDGWPPIPKPLPSPPPAPGQPGQPGQAVAAAAMLAALMLLLPSAAHAQFSVACSPQPISYTAGAGGKVPAYACWIKNVGPAAGTLEPADLYAAVLPLKPIEPGVATSLIDADIGKLPQSKLVKGLQIASALGGVAYGAISGSFTIPLAVGLISQNLPAGIKIIQGTVPSAGAYTSRQLTGPVTLMPGASTVAIVFVARNKTPAPISTVIPASAPPATPPAPAPSVAAAPAKIALVSQGCPAFTAASTFHEPPSVSEASSGPTMFLPAV